jgi:ribosomal protein S18 acetylase RimI-like enzyme
MLETVLKAAKEIGFEQAELEVISDNQNAITLYEKLGFQKYGTFPDNLKYADGHYTSADWMMKKL